jgi:hypothetical protein
MGIGLDNTPLGLRSERQLLQPGQLTLEIVVIDE